MTPPRRDKPKAHLDASVVPVERALLARAGVLEAEYIRQDKPTDLQNLVLLHTAQEFRALAEELHYW